MVGSFFKSDLQWVVVDTEEGKETHGGTCIKTEAESLLVYIELIVDAEISELVSHKLSQCSFCVLC